MKCLFRPCANTWSLLSTSLYCPSARAPTFSACASRKSFTQLAIVGPCTLVSFAPTSLERFKASAATQSRKPVACLGYVSVSVLPVSQIGQLHVMYSRIARRCAGGLSFLYVALSSCLHAAECQR